MEETGCKGWIQAEEKGHKHWSWGESQGFRALEDHRVTWRAGWLAGNKNGKQLTKNRRQ